MWHLILLPGALLATLALQLTTVSYFYYQDDYVPFGEMVTNGGRTYIWNLLTAQDLTPNWRPLPGLLYFASYKAFGMDPLPVHIVTLALHVGTAALIYYVLWRTTAKAWAACAGALFFGLNPAYVGALSQVTTATQQMAGFFLIATLAAVVECALVTGRRRQNLWLSAGVALYILAVASHEGMAIIFPAFGLALLTFDAAPNGRLIRSVARSTPFAVIGLATAGAFGACKCNEGTSVWGTDHAWNETLIYAGRLVYPLHLEPLTRVDQSHVIGAAVLALIAVITCAFGPRIARVGAPWMALAMAPHVFIQYSTASRYLYLPSIGYALLFAAFAVMLADPLLRVNRWVVLAAGPPLLAALCVWYSYQTVQQDRYFADATSRWRTFHSDVTRVWTYVPAGTRVVIIGGPFQAYDFQPFILPAFAQTTWGPGVTLTDAEPGSLPAQLALAYGGPYVAQYGDDGILRAVPR
jgi:hypothetical protein